MFFDKVLKQVHESVIVLDDFTEFPSIRAINGQVLFNVGTPRNFLNVTDSRTDYYANRLALMEERVFSHTDTYMRAKLSVGDQGEKGLTVVHHVHSVVGSVTAKWVLGMLT
jgi:hypothetical protein